MTLRTLTRIIPVVLLAAAATASADSGYKTFFHHLDRAWAVGELEMFRPLEYRDGKLLTFPGRFVDLTYAKHPGAKTVVIIEERQATDAETYIRAEERLYAPLAVLPRYSYWRDNLSQTPHHTVLGGRRNAFRGAEIAVVKPIAATYTSAAAEKMPRKAELKMEAVVAALGCGIDRLRDDAAQYLYASGTQHRFMTGAVHAKFAAFVTATGNEDARRTVIEAAGRWKMKRLAPALEKVAAGGGALAAAALEALEEIGALRTTEQLAELIRSDDEPVRAYAAGAYGEHADALGAWAVVEKLNDADKPVSLRTSLAAGLGRSRNPKAVAALAAALARGDGASRMAAAGLAAIGNKDAVAELEKAVVSGPPAARTVAVVAIAEVPDCADCLLFLDKQFNEHPDENVRDVIRAVTGRPAEHH